MRAAERPFVKFAEAEQQHYAQRDRQTLERVLFFAWFAGRFGDINEISWPELLGALDIIVTPPQVEVRDPEKETRVRQILNAAMSAYASAAGSGLPRSPRCGLRFVGLDDSVFDLACRR